jgi:hypothetical protein
VIAEVKRCAGTQFDPIVAEAFCRIAERDRENFVVNSAMTVLQRQAAKHYARATRPDPDSIASADASPIPLPVAT